MITHKTFNWSITNRDLVLLVPNFGRGNYIRKVLDSLTKTVVPSDKWMILVANDSIHEDFSDLQEKNLYYFTFDRSPPWERGDAFMRNIVIKYGQSQMLAQKDPEIFYTGDFIKGCFDHPEVLYRCGECSYCCEKNDTDLYFSGKIDAAELQRRTKGHPIVQSGQHGYVCWHFGHCAPTKAFRELGGYDEDFKSYGYVDKDMHERLMKAGLTQYFDKNCRPIHLWHKKAQVYTDEADKKRYKTNTILYNKKHGTSIIRNVGVEWGEGDPNYLYDEWRTNNG